MFFSKRQHGVGLGLALVKQIVDAHQGRIEVDSEPGAGARFEVLWPAASGEPRSQGALEAASAPAVAPRS
jgi:signal transduction histidine kinase